MVCEVNDKHNLKKEIDLSANETLGGCCSSSEQD